MNSKNTIVSLFKAISTEPSHAVAIMEVLFAPLTHHCTTSLPVDMDSIIHLASIEVTSEEIAEFGSIKALTNSIRKVARNQPGLYSPADHILPAAYSSRVTDLCCDVDQGGETEALATIVSHKILGMLCFTAKSEQTY
jgi:hypothetical protein